MTSNVILFEDRCDCEAKLPRQFDVLTSKVALIGNSTVGKTCMVGRWIKGHSVLHDVDETGEHEEDLFHKIIEYDALTKSANFQECCKLLKHASLDEIKKVSSNVYQNMAYSDSQNTKYDATLKLDVQVVDVTHFDATDYSDLRHLQVNQADGFILCYDTTNPATLADMTLYHRIITRIKGDDVPIIVCGTKIDCISERKVSEDEVIGLCEEMGVDFDTCYFENSAMENINIDETFYAILHLIEKRKLAKTHTNCCKEPQHHSMANGTVLEKPKFTNYLQSSPASSPLKDSESTAVSVPPKSPTLGEYSTTSISIPLLDTPTPPSPAAEQANSIKNFENYREDADEKTDMEARFETKRATTIHSMRTMEQNSSSSESNSARSSRSKGKRNEKKKRSSSGNTCCIIC
ncbi:uncharacterized protein KLLA0_E11639g [Kluyveromyces lactis]|uniref:KLLA0E11639p n=1 Tax=Kluyveromyces lactis (strain ATCC 8585 / CBS 2359 / DSM 70799 / NBRC 1267 / NRRL Y-1140 / WM37) TaxID=284590 RepID=Q6CNL3_KLULA|nr:uncharacterized protein KLLA0_E11639g [Kluyveromyces lactis]CAG99563.1 KLLA0E11639p [Kluyveromyces lactis]|eukprot:XP_454476.1 uncharacterized protein KLLA0_E11639g [Kluyveromyces lactis]